MRLTRVDFRGYKRLRETGCNVDGQLMAFVGPNEAGKSSVLEGLQWLTDESPGPLRLPLVSRVNRESVGGRVVSATFALDSDDLAIIQDLDTDVTPTQFVVSRDRDGQVNFEIRPPITRRAAPRQAALAALKALVGRKDLDTSAREAVGGRVEALMDGLDSHGNGWYDGAGVDAQAVVAWLRTEPELSVASEGEENEFASETSALSERRADPLDEAAADAINQVVTQMGREDPAVEGATRLWKRSPDFLLFTGADRVLESAYELADENIRANPPAALQNLLAVAGASIHELFAAVQDDDQSQRLGLLKTVNQNLLRDVSPKWRQARIAVELSLNGSQLEVNVNEMDEGGGISGIAERSDGLKTFVALVAFLAKHHRKYPPILLIDEAETHLHYDAQADLLDFLLEVQAAQVIYTTHSPGCLPPDLGTGIRLVAPDPDRNGTSNLRNDFWSSTEHGFTPLLFAMGAGAAAFSACRSAVLAEGAADMILVPTLIRTAAGLKRLDYQVAPGLANTPPRDLGGTDLLAARVAYLADGDPGGDEHRRHLEEAGVPPDRIVQFSGGRAPEDMLEPEAYLVAVNSVLEEAGKARRITVGELDISIPISSAVAAVFTANDESSPGKTVVASRLVRDPASVILTDAGRAELIRIHEQLASLLSGPGSPRESG